jgi:hypothetical protein
MFFLIAPANKTGIQLFAPDGSLIAPDSTGLYNIVGYENLAAQHPDFAFLDASGAGPNAWAAPTGPIDFSATIAPSPTANTWNPSAGEQNQIPVYNPPSTAQWLTWPVVFSAKLVSVAITFGGTFGGSELVTFQLNRLYANRGPITPASIPLQAAVTGTQQLSAAQLAAIANANSPLVCLWGQVMSSIANSNVTATIQIITD